MVSSNYRNFVLLGTFIAVVVVVLGVFTRLVDAGLGCPDWPGCYGHLLWPDSAGEIAVADKAFPDTPVDTDKTWPEMVHRYVAGSLLLLVLAMTVVAWRTPLSRTMRQLTTVLLVLICCQAAFGAWTVTLKLWPQVVTAHLLGGFATLSMLWAIYLHSGGAQQLWLSSVSKFELTGHARLALVVVVLQVALGGWLSANYAALACADFPTCFGSYWPEMDMAAGFNIVQEVGPNYLGGLLESEARVAIHWTHRMGALAVLGVIGLLAWRLLSVNRSLGMGLMAILAVQITLGVLNVVWALPLSIAILHNAVGALLLLAIVTVNFAPEKSVATLHD